MIFFVLFVLLTVGVLLRRRRVLKARLAGLEASRPVFSVNPPGGRLGKLKDGAL